MRGSLKKMLVWTTLFEALGPIQRVSIILLYFRGVLSFLHPKTISPPTSPSFAVARSCTIFMLVVGLVLDWVYMWTSPALDQEFDLLGSTSNIVSTLCI